MFVGVLESASGAPIGETDGVCGGGSDAPDAPETFCATSVAGLAMLGAVFESGAAPVAVGVFGGVAVAGRVLGALGAVLDAPASWFGDRSVVDAPPALGEGELGFLGRVPPPGTLPPGADPCPD